jgi:hypothetical protein
MNTITEIIIIILHIIVLYFELNKSLKDNWSKFKPLFELSDVKFTIFSAASSKPWSLSRIISGILSKQFWPLRNFYFIWENIFVSRLLNEVFILILNITFNLILILFPQIL